MKSLEKSTPDHRPDEASIEMVETWRRTHDALETERLRRLRSLSEREAARQFAQWLQPSILPSLRPSSGLVEQQRLLDRLR